MKHVIRPDGRCFVLGPPDGTLPSRRIHATADEADVSSIRALEALGFTVQRRELVLRVPTRVPPAAPPPGIALVRADVFDETRLRLLDDLLRQDVPGTDGWKWSAAGFRAETYDSSDFDPATYLVAVGEDGAGIGIVRVWMRPGAPRLGFVGVRAELRSRGVARALLAAALDAARRAGAPEVHTEVDEKNAASQALLFGIGGEQTGASLELVREAAGPLELRLRASTPDDAEAIALVQVRSALAGFAGFRPDGALASLDPEERVPLWRERRAIVADTDDGVVGFVQHGPSGDEPAGEIQRFFVAPECWGEGVGRALMRCALAELRDAGFGEAVLWVHADNDRARRFYEGCGWRPDGAERDEEAFGEVVQELRHRIRLDRGLMS